MNSRLYYFNAAKYVISRFLLGKKYLVGKAEKYQLKIKFPIADGGGRKIYKRGTYETEVSDFLTSNLNLNEGDLILDIGANIGWYSILLGRYFPQSRIFSFEPGPENINCFNYNKQVNQVPNVELVPKAVAEKNDRQTLYLYKPSNAGRHSLLPINAYGSMEVETTRLDDFIESRHLDTSKIRLIKIDIEGYELNALKGAPRLLSQLEVMIIEYGPGYMRKGNIDPAELLSLLESHQFIPYQFDTEPQPTTYREIARSVSNLNLLLLKPGQTLIKLN